MLKTGKTESSQVVLLFFLLVGLFGGTSYAERYWAGNSESDHKVCFRWEGLRNACAFFKWHRLYIVQQPNGAIIHQLDNCAVSHSGCDYVHNIGPNQSRNYTMHTQYYGTGCDYNNGIHQVIGTTARLRPPGALTATDGKFDTKVELTWGATNSDVPSNLRQYRIYRDSVLVATVAGTVTTWTDNNIVPGTVYSYAVCTWAATWNAESERKTDSGHAFDLNVRTESLASGVKVLWDLPPAGNALNIIRFTIERQDTTAPVYMTAIESATATSWTDQSAVPGYTYTYIVKPASATVTHRADQARGTRLANGSISGYVTAPAGGGVDNVIITVQRLDDIAQGQGRDAYRDTTDATGYYSIDRIYYCESARFSVTPSRDTHGFRPNSQTLTLSTALSVRTDINFTDTSSFAIGCRVIQVFAGDTLGLSERLVSVNRYRRNCRTNMGKLTISWLSRTNRKRYCHQHIRFS